MASINREIAKKLLETEALGLREVAEQSAEGYRAVEARISKYRKAIEAKGGVFRQVVMDINRMSALWDDVPQEELPL